MRKALNISVDRDAIKRVTMRGFIVSDFAQKYDPARAAMADMVRTGKLKFREDIVEGLEKAPGAFIGLLRGDNFGKLQIKVGQEPAGLPHRR